LLLLRAQVGELVSLKPNAPEYRQSHYNQEAAE
jgi:hypothetical protein